MSIRYVRISIKDTANFAILHSRRVFSSYENDGDNSLIVLWHCGPSNFGPSLLGNYYTVSYTTKRGWGLFRNFLIVFDEYGDQHNIAQYNTLNVTMSF